MRSEQKYMAYLVIKLLSESLNSHLQLSSFNYHPNNEFSSNKE